MTKNYSPDVTPLNQQRRPQNAMSDEWTRDFFCRAQVGHLGTRWENQPFVTPTNFWYDEERGEIYIHSSITGRMHANAEKFPEVCFEVSEWGKLLPANTALQFTIQYESAIAFGRIRIVEDEEEKKRALYGHIAKYFPGMKLGVEYRPITEDELKRTCVYAITIESLSGKRNWKERAVQSEDWPPLDESWFE